MKVSDPPALLGRPMMHPPGRLRAAHNMCQVGLRLHPEPPEPRGTRIAKLAECWMSAHSQTQWHLAVHRTANHVPDDYEHKI